MLVFEAKPLHVGQRLFHNDLEFITKARLPVHLHVGSLVVHSYTVEGPWLRHTVLLTTLLSQDDKRLLELNQYFLNLIQVQLGKTSDYCI